MNEASAFLTALVKAPDDITGRLVFADWLDEHSDPKGAYVRAWVQLRAITKASPVQDEARALLEHLSSPEFMNAYFNVAIYGPVLTNQEKLQAFDGTNTILVGLLGLAKNGTAPAYPDVNNAAFADLGSNFLIPKLAQRVVVDGWDFEKAIAEAQTQGQAIYDKY